MKGPKSGPLDPGSRVDPGRETSNRTDLGLPGLRRGIYLLPSLFTMGNILLGFYAVVQGLRGNFDTAALAILGAGIVDALDGRIARLTGTESDFGKEFDSLADILTFGFVPALLAYCWGLDDLGRIGWLIPLFFVVCGATRLARFNVQSHREDPRNFVGLPIPAAAGTIASILYFAPDPNWKAWLAIGLMVTLICLGFLMVSTFRYASFKKMDLRRRRSYRLAIPLAATLILVAYHPPTFLMSVAILYTLSGPFGFLLRAIRHDQRQTSESPSAANEGDEPS